MAMHPFFGKQEVLAKYRTRMAAHIAADELVQRVGWETSEYGTEGCFVGCTLDRYAHEGFVDELNIPVEIAYVLDAIHEGLPEERVNEFATRFFSEVSLESDASTWWPRFAIAILTDKDHGAIKYAENKVVVEDVASLYKRRLADDEPRKSEWASARAAASDAASAAASDAAWAAIWAAAWAAAWAASDAARAAARATWSAHYIWQAETLLAIVKS